MRIRMVASRQGKFGDFPIGWAGEVDEALAAMFVNEGAAVKLDASGSPVAAKPSKPARDKSDESLESLGIPERAANVLRANEIDSRSELERFLDENDDDLTLIHGIGATTAALIGDALDHYEPSQI